ncbi:MAG: thiamine-binding protein [Dermatophilaceae bacterium]
MLVAFSVAPSGGADDSGSVSQAVAAAIRVVRDSGLPNRTDAMFTTIEGEWDECFAVVKGAVDAIAAVSPRVALVLKADLRPGHTGELDGKVERLEAILGARTP